MRSIIALLLLSFPSIVSTTNAQNLSQAEWVQFRETYPYHIQATAIGNVRTDGSRILIVSEPPPHITLQDFIALNHDYLSQAVVEKNKIGYDGWVKDIVVQLPQLQDAALRDLLDTINYHLYGTTYKADLLELPATRSAPPDLPLDLQVTTSDLNRWLFAGTLKFKGIGDADVWTITQVLQQKRNGTYLSVEPGIVLWVLPRRGDYTQFRREAREFALDADTIVGAVTSATHLAIVARERVVPLDVLPPLRSETIFQLAEVASDSLEQSYERTYILAGKYDGQRDWAPIYLSNTLIDTEYGSLLNLTDQLLKSWSMAGLVKYVDFPYPAPSAPFPFPGGLANDPVIQKAMDESDEGLTFNWNTKGAGYVDTAGGTFRIYALYRTGALPVSYLSGGENNTSHEKTAYRWFAEKTHDPNLARVVQYAALYQMFHEFRIRDVSATPIADKQPQTGSLASPMTAALNAFRVQDCDMPSTKPGEENEADEHRFAHLLALGPLADSCAKIASLYDEYGSVGIRALAALLASGHRSEPDIQLWKSVLSKSKNERVAYVKSLSKEKQARLVSYMVSIDVKNDWSFQRALTKHFSFLKARDMYVAAASRPEAGWIRTSSIVVSWPTGAFAKYTGGHNLYASVGRFVEDGSVAPGEIRIIQESGERVIHYNPADRARLPEWIHDAAVTKDNAALSAKVKQTFLKPPDVPSNRTVSVALKSDRVSRTERGLTSDLAGQRRPGALGWGETTAPTSREAMAAHDVGSKPTRALMVERLDDGYYRVLEGRTGQVYRARSLTDVMDIMVSSLKRAPGKPPTTLVLAGFDEGEAVSFRSTAESWMERESLDQRNAPTVRMRDETIALDRAVQPLSEQGDLLHARFGDWQLKDVTLPSGKAGKVYETKVEVPPIGQLRGFFLKVQIYLESVFPSLEKLRSLEMRAKASFSNLPPNANAASAAAALENDLRSVSPDVHSVVLELLDIVTAQEPSEELRNAYSQTY